VTAIHETAYPRLKFDLTPRQLAELFTPTREEIALADGLSRGNMARLGFLLLLKTFQSLGYFVLVRDIPPAIIRCIEQALRLDETPVDLLGYDSSGTRQRHIHDIRAYLNVHPYSGTAKRHVEDVLETVAQIKDEPADLVNVAIEELLRQRFELPAFRTLSELADSVRVRVNRRFYQKIYDGLDEVTIQTLNTLFVVDEKTGYTAWNRIREDAGKPNLTHFREWVDQYAWLSKYSVGAATLGDVPAVKLKHLAAEAKSLDSDRLFGIKKKPKKYALAALITVKLAQTLDDLTDMFIKRMTIIQNNAKAAFDKYKLKQQEQANAMVAALRQVALGFHYNDTPEQQYTAIDDILGPQIATLLETTETHLAYANNVAQAFTLDGYKTYRSVLFDFIKIVRLRSTDQDKALEEAIGFLRQHQADRTEWLPTVATLNKGQHDEREVPLLDLSWVSDTWWPLITGQKRRGDHPKQVHRRYFEVGLFTHVMWDLKAGDLAVEESDTYSDHDRLLIPWEALPEALALYHEQSGLPVEPQALADFIRRDLEDTAQKVDQSFPNNQQVHLEKGRPVIRKAKKKAISQQAEDLETTLHERLTEVNILTAIFKTSKALDLTRFFGPISGYDAKIKDQFIRYTITLFCYGCGLGPTQTARTLEGIKLDRRDVAWINKRHVTEDGLDELNREIINAYNKFLLPKIWGSGKHVSADGTKWDVYEDNLLAQYHIRYGGYGGIAYYHISDTYIALFSNFFVCGAWEGIYILDMFEKNESDIQPDTVHADTHGQHEPLFGLAYLLGIKLMPRIRRWRDLIFYRSRKELKYDHIDDLFTVTIDWELIRDHLLDMLRIVLSIRAGRISPSAILRRLSSYSRKNRLYLAFRELGRAIRTRFLLLYLADEDLRTMIQAAMNKNEGFNRFAKWVAFGKGGVITENDRDEQRKMIKYNHVIANILIFYTVTEMTRVLNQLTREGYLVTKEAVQDLSPYITEYINRFGNYAVQLDVSGLDLDYSLPILTPFPDAA
jgi:TnpA family transposase